MVISNGRMWNISPTQQIDKSKFARTDFLVFHAEKGTKSVAQCLISLNEDSYWDVHGSPI